MFRELNNGQQILFPFLLQRKTSIYNLQRLYDEVSKIKKSRSETEEKIFLTRLTFLAASTFWWSRWLSFVYFANSFKKSGYLHNLCTGEIKKHSKWINFLVLLSTLRLQF